VFWVSDVVVISIGFDQSKPSLLPAQATRMLIRAHVITALEPFGPSGLSISAGVRTRIHRRFSNVPKSLKTGTFNLAQMGDLTRFGPKYLNPSELKQRLEHFLGCVLPRGCSCACRTVRGQGIFEPAEGRVRGNGSSLVD